jgi:hypothetical protein
MVLESGVSPAPGPESGSHPAELRVQHQAERPDQTALLLLGAVMVIHALHEERERRSRG